MVCLEMPMKPWIEVVDNNIHTLNGHEGQLTITLRQLHTLSNIKPTYTVRHIRLLHALLPATIPAPTRHIHDERYRRLGPFVVFMVIITSDSRGIGVPSTGLEKVQCGYTQS